MHTPIRTSAPGSMMLLGEHAVLHGHHALVCALNRRIHVMLSPRSDREIHITSSLGRLELTLDTIEPKEPLAFVLGAVAQRKGDLKSGFDLTVQSEFTHKAGLGSSAAVTVATTAALGLWLDEKVEEESVLRASVAIIQDIQGLGSGADAAASVYGGILLYRAKPLKVMKLGAVHPVTLVYSGSKKPTAEVVRLVEAAHAKQPATYDRIYELMGHSAEEAAAAIERGDWQSVGGLLNINQGLMDAIGVCDGKLAGIVYALRKDPGILGAKISGSGLGDCVIGLGRARNEAFSYDQLPTAMASEGLVIGEQQPV
ncbi:MAG: mevalonate kinase [Verrucomicrobia bacterium ADurb.Bin345]|nr:MAG: mevalonate kinase [Verrucomicrobia bacterium ADurb.Bin345]